MRALLIAFDSVQAVVGALLWLAPGFLRMLREAAR
jgi:hypothetical protein